MFYLNVSKLSSQKKKKKKNYKLNFLNSYFIYIKKKCHGPKFIAEGKSLFYA